MRLQEQLNLLGVSLEKTRIQANKLSNGSIKIINMKELNEGISIIQDLDYLHPELKKIMEVDFFYNYVNDELILTPELYSTLTNFFNQLRTKIKITYDLIQTLLPEEDELSINIKLPNHNSLQDISSDLLTIDKILNQILTHKEINSGYSFKNFDVGSSWICLVIASGLALKFIAGLVWSACVIRKKKIECDILVEHAKTLTIKNESLQDIVDGQKKLLETLTHSEAENLLEENNIGNTDPEFLKRLIYAITQTAELINKGAEIHPALYAPEDSKNLFPDFKNLNLIESKTKLIKDN